MAIDPTLLKVSQVAELLGVTHGVVRRWIARKQLSAFRLHGHYRVNRQDALKMLEKATPEQPQLPMDPKTEEILRRHGLAPDQIAASNERTAKREAQRAAREAQQATKRNGTTNQ